MNLKDKYYPILDNGFQRNLFNSSMLLSTNLENQLTSRVAWKQCAGVGGGGEDKALQVRKQLEAQDTAFCLLSDIC